MMIGSWLIMLISLLLVALLSAAALLFPESLTPHFEEDGIVETATAIAYFLAFCLGVFVILRNRKFSLLFFGATLFALIACLDELSWGERILGWEPYEILGIRLDSVHDLLMFPKKIAERSDYPYLTFGFIIAVLLGTVLILANKYGSRALSHARDTLDTSFLVLILVIVFISAAQIIDMHLPGLRQAWISAAFVEENLEFAASFAMVCFMLIHLREWQGAASAGVGSADNRADGVKSGPA